MVRAHAPIDLMTTLEQVSVPSFVADRQGRITWVNRAAESAFGNVVGRSMAAVVSPEDLPLVRRQYERKLRGVPVTDYEVDVLTADGHRRRAEISSVLIEGGDDCHAIFGVALAGRRRQNPPSRTRLTPRQLEVLHLLDRGASTDQIAARLHLSRETVRNHIRHILRALGAHSRLEAVVIARLEGLAPGPGE
jgi:PAS domain S-box-containing protein